MITALPSAPPTTRVLVRDALRRHVAGGGWPCASWTIFQNRLLDEVGGDLRPLVALLVRAGEVGLVEQLPSSRAAWPQVRGALVLSLTNGAFLQPEMARWAVECWAFAVGVATEADLTVAADPRLSAPLPAVVPARAPAEPAAPAAAPAASLPAASLPAAPARRPTARPGAAPRVTPVAMPPLATAAGRRAAATVGGAVTSVGAASVAAAGPQPLPPPTVTIAVPAARARRTGRLPAGLDNPVAGASLLGIALFGGYVVYSAALMPAARASEVDPARSRVAPPVIASASAAAGAPALAAGIPGVTAHGLPGTAADSLRMIRVVPTRRPTLPLEQLPATPPPARFTPVGAAQAEPPTPPPTPPPGPPAAAPAQAGGYTATAATPAADGFDRLRLRDGRVLRGRVELVRVAAVVFRDADTGLRFEYPKVDVDAVVTEFGSVVRFSPPIAAPAMPGGRLAARAEAGLVYRGVAGRYLVRYTMVSVTGSPECRRGWDAAPPAAWAQVDHAPGADTLAIRFDGGGTFASVIDAEAQFASTFVIVPDQAYTGSALTTRLNGRFTPDGFDAAVNLVGYRRVRDGRDVACHTVLRAEGRLDRPLRAGAASAGNVPARTTGRPARGAARRGPG